jgi:hypothetical protein
MNSYGPINPGTNLDPLPCVQFMMADELKGFRRKRSWLTPNVILEFFRRSVRKCVWCPGQDSYLWPPERVSRATSPVGDSQGTQPRVFLSHQAAHQSFSFTLPGITHQCSAQTYFSPLVLFVFIAMRVRIFFEMPIMYTWCGDPAFTIQRPRMVESPSSTPLPPNCSVVCRQRARHRGPDLYRIINLCWSPSALFWVLIVCLIRLHELSPTDWKYWYTRICPMLSNDREKTDVRNSLPSNGFANNWVSTSKMW